jgi:hypothetical protein
VFAIAVEIFVDRDQEIAEVARFASVREQDAFDGVAENDDVDRSSRVAGRARAQAATASG